MERRLKIINRIALVLSILALIGSILERDISEFMAWGIILMYNIRELIVGK